MVDASHMPVEERLLRLFEALGISRAHIAARVDADWQGLVSRFPDRVGSLSLLCPLALDATQLAGLASRLLVISGDRGAAGERVQNAVAAQGITAATLRDYDGVMWSDVTADRSEEVTAALLDFLARTDRDQGGAPVGLAEGDGEIAGISYRIQGAGPPLVLMPLWLAPSQWEPIVPQLARHYCTMQLGGAFLGIVAALEARGRSVYLGIVRTLLDAVGIEAGQAVLDIGCGSGVVIREVARRCAGLNRLVAVDVSPYLLREARQLARIEGHGDVIAFQEGRAEALPFADDSMDVTLSATVFEEGDAERMLAEMIRVTKPGGRVAVIVRAIDLPGWVNLPLKPATKAKAQAPGLFGAGVAPGGCADASLYERLRAAGLTRLQFFPQLAPVGPDDPRFPVFQQQALAALSAEEAAKWRGAVEQATAAGTAFIAMPHHCAVGSKPG